MSSYGKSKPAASPKCQSDDEDDNWDDWGDAEDNLVSEPASTEENHNKIVRDKPSVKENDFNSNKEKESPATTPVPGGGTWGSSMWNKWGAMSSVLSTATESLGNITSTVSHGLNQVIGVPDPEELARMNAEPKNEERENERAINERTHDSSIDACESAADEVTTPAFGLNLVSGVTTLGSKVLNTGLDTLEGIGKKTMTMLQENDPLLRNKRKLLGLEADKPNLSELLKEAKKDADQWENTLKEMKLEKSKEMLRFDLLFEHNCGLVHLEALEILSKESTLKLQSLLEAVSGKALAELEETINEVKELMELEELDGESEGDYTGTELNEKLLSAVEDADLQIHFDEIAQNWSQSLEWLTGPENEAANEETLFAKALTTMAECCALEMNKLHKIAELLLVKEHHSTANEVDSIVQLCKQFNSHLNGLTHRFAAALTGKNTDAAKDHAATLYADLQVGLQQNEKAFKLFLPILQIGAV